MEETGGETVPTNVLGMLTRLRQLALHPGLVPPTYVDELRDRGTSGAPKPAINLNPEDKAKLQAALAKMIEDSEECPVCFGILNDPRITTCSHAFCLAWSVQAVLVVMIRPADRKHAASVKSFNETPNVLWYSHET
jgi:SWI/SNF-related matrix-associated actin-dependent regulator of chromatin subfamily A3